MDVGDVWVNIRADTTQVEAGIESTKTKIASMEPTIKGTRRELHSFWRDAAFIALPLTVGFAAISAEIKRIGDTAVSIRKLSNELDISYEAAQRLQGAEKGVYNQPIFSDQEVEKLATVSSEIYLLTNYLDVTIGKWMVWNEARYKDGGLPGFLGDVGSASLKAAKDGEKFNKWLEKVAEDSIEAAKRIKDAERALRDIARTQEDLAYSTEGERFVQSDLTGEYSALEKELRGLDPAMYGDTATIAATAARKKAIQARMLEIEHEMKGSQMTVKRNTEDTQTLKETGAANVKIIIEDKTISNVQLQILKDSQDAGWLVLHGYGGSY